MEQEEIFDKIEDYLIGRMNEAERMAFEKQIAADEDLKMDVEFQRLEHDAMRTLNEKSLRAKMAEWETDIPKQDSDRGTPLVILAKDERKTGGTKIVSLPNRWLRYAAAASVILGVVLAGLWFNKDPEPIVVTVDKPTKVDTVPLVPPISIEKPKEPIVQTPEKPNIKPDNIKNRNTLPPQYNDLLVYAETNLDEEKVSKDNTTRSDNNPNKEEWTSIIDAYQAKNYAKASALLQKLPTGNTQQEMLGLVYFRLKQYDKAASCFKSIVNDPNAVFYKNRNEWNLALCYAAQYPAKAGELKKLLEGILAVQKHPHFKAATILRDSFLK